MGLTRYPNGLTTNSTTALQYNTNAGDGDLDCLDLFTAGTASLVSVAVTSLTATSITVTNLTATNFSLSTANSFVGERAYVEFTFTSAASTTYRAVPFNGNVIDCWTTSDATPRTVSGFTLQAGSGGTVYVATVTTLVFATAAGQQFQPALTPAAITTASALAVVVTTAGSAANFSVTAVIQRTA